MEIESLQTGYNFMQNNNQFIMNEGLDESSERPEQEKSDIKQTGNCKIIHTLDTKDNVFFCETSPSGNWIAAGTDQGKVRIFSLRTGALVYVLVDVEIRQTCLPASCCTWLNDQTVIVGYVSGYIKIWNVENQECLTTIYEKRQIMQCILTPTHDAIITSGDTEELFVYGLERREKMRVCRPSPSYDIMDGHRSHVYALKHHPRDVWNFLSGGWDNTVQYWDRREEHSVKKIFGPHICGQGIDIDPNTNSILTASWRRREGLQIWDYREASLVRTYPEEPGEHCLYYAAKFLGEKHIIAGGSNKNLFHVRDRAIASEIGSVKKLPKGMFCLDVSGLERSSELHKGRVAFGFSTTLCLAEIENIVPVSND